MRLGFFRLNCFKRNNLAAAATATATAIAATATATATAIAAAIAFGIAPRNEVISKSPHHSNSIVAAFI